MITCEDLGCPAGTQFVGSSGSNVYHICDSTYAKIINPDNRVCFANSEEAVAQGYRAAEK